MSEQIKVGDTVWVTEHKSDKKKTPLPREWYGDVIKIKDESVQVKDTDPDSTYFNEVFPRQLCNLKLKG